MKTVVFTIDYHPDRMDLIRVLHNNGYETEIRLSKKYRPPRYVVEVKVKESEDKSK